MCNDCYENNKYEQEAYSTESIALTDAELEILNLPPTFPKTDKAFQKKLRHSKKLKQLVENPSTEFPELTPETSE
jgi:hypothetical protein